MTILPIHKKLIWYTSATCKQFEINSRHKAVSRRSRSPWGFFGSRCPSAFEIRSASSPPPSSASRRHHIRVASRRLPLSGWTGCSCPRGPTRRPQPPTPPPRGMSRPGGALRRRRGSGATCAPPPRSRTGSGTAPAAFRKTTAASGPRVFPRECIRPRPPWEAGVSLAERAGGAVAAPE